MIRCSSLAGRCCLYGLSRDHLLSKLPAADCSTGSVHSTTVACPVFSRSLQLSARQRLERLEGQPCRPGASKPQSRLPCLQPPRSGSGRSILMKRALRYCRAVSSRASTNASRTLERMVSAAMSRCRLRSPIRPLSAATKRSVRLTFSIARVAGGRIARPDKRFAHSAFTPAAFAIFVILAISALM